jgi:hypothetical protein
MWEFDAIHFVDLIAYSVVYGDGFPFTYAVDGDDSRFFER